MSKKVRSAPRILTVFVLTSNDTKDAGRLTKQLFNGANTASARIGGGAIFSSGLHELSMINKISFLVVDRKSGRKHVERHCRRCLPVGGWPFRDKFQRIFHGASFKCSRRSLRPRHANSPPQTQQTCQDHSTRRVQSRLLPEAGSESTRTVHCSPIDQTWGSSQASFKMALLNYRAPVDYIAQLQAFTTFLDKFETSKTTASTDEAAEAIDGLHLDGDHTSDEYDFMDDVANDDAAQSRRDARRPTKRKYMDMLQEVADRDRTNILIELDDLREVRDYRLSMSCF